MKQHSNRLNAKGFGHLEIVLVIALVVVIALAGFFVYKHDHKNSTVHAATGWTFISDWIVRGAPGQPGAPLINVYACLQTINTPSGTYYNVEGLARSNIRVFAKIAPGISDDYISGSRWDISSTSWNNQEVRMSHSVNIGETNWIDPIIFPAGGSVSSGPGGNVGIHALSLANCAG